MLLFNFIYINLKVILINANTLIAIKKHLLEKFKTKKNTDKKFFETLQSTNFKKIKKAIYFLKVYICYQGAK